MRGYVLTMDVTIGAAIAIFLMIASTYYVNSTYEAGYGPVSMKRVATDVISVLESNGTLGTLEPTRIRNGINSLLPGHLEMGINITSYDESGAIKDRIDIDYESSKERYAGRWGFLTFQGSETDSFAIVDYWVAVR